MKTNPNEPIDTVCSDALGQTIYFGLTKREHMAIEFTKSAQIANPTGYDAHLAKWGIELADELIKQLNAEK